MYWISGIDMEHNDTEPTLWLQGSTSFHKCAQRQMSRAAQKPLHDHHTSSFLESIYVLGGGYHRSLLKFKCSDQRFKRNVLAASNSSRQVSDVDACNRLIDSVCDGFKTMELHKVQRARAEVRGARSQKGRAATGSSSRPLGIETVARCLNGCSKS